MPLFSVLNCSHLCMNGSESKYRFSTACRAGKHPDLADLVRDAYRRAWRKALEVAQLDGFRFHDLRHTYASWTMQRGASLPALQAILGHATLAMTMRYSHLAPAHLRATVALLDGAMVPPARAQETADSGTTVQATGEVSRKF